MFTKATDNLAGTGLTFSVIEGNPFSGPVATFTDSASPGATPADFTATINWGDGTTTAGTITEPSTSNFTVSGNHTYADDGHYMVTVTVTANLPGTNSASATSTANVGEALLSMQGTNAVTLPEGVSASGAVATLTDPSATGPASDYSGTINWGDGVTDAATIISLGDGKYELAGTHTYADEGSYFITVTAWDVDDAPFTISIEDHVTVTETDTLLPVATSHLNGIEGHTLAGVVSNFSDIGYPDNAASDFSATIAWGDGVTSPGTISKSGASIAVSGTHRYADEGSYSTTVTIADDAPGTATGTGHNIAIIADAPLTILDTFGAATTPLTTYGPAVLARFIDTAGPEYCPLSDFSATINWGDGSSTDTATPGNGGITTTSTSCVFNVEGTHMYLTTGNFTVNITIHDVGGAAAASGAGSAVIHVMFLPTTYPLTPAQRAVAAQTTSTQHGYSVGISLGESTTTSFGGGIALYLDPAHSFNLMACYTGNSALSTCWLTVLSVFRTGCGAAGAVEVIYARYYLPGSTTGYLARIQITQGSNPTNGAIQINAVTSGGVYLGASVIANASMTC